MRSSQPTMIATLVALLTMIPSTANAKMCLMLYQVADNNLEYYLRQDYGELAASPVVNSEDLRTWVYYDAFNQGGMYIPRTVDADGNAVENSYHGSRYMTFDKSMGQMRIDVELDTEMNSDLTSTVQHFLEHAMTDCIAHGHDQLMAVFASHGGGFAGYGGDENKQGRRSRNLLQSNSGLSTAIRGALDNVEGASDRLEVIGFDACLMSAVGAADDYHGVARYLLGSEAVEPGHGWSYNTLTDASSPMALAQNILDDFLLEKQGRASHQAPKTLAIVDTDKFVTFVDMFEKFSEEMLLQLEQGDVSLHTFVSRARASSVAFDGVADIVGTENPSALDIGSFLNQLEALCNPGGNLGGLLMSAQESYKEMFVSAGVGPGTPPATGMHITWPHQGEYNSNNILWNQILFSNGKYVTSIAPNYQEFIRWFLTSTTPTATDGSSVCGLGAEPANNLGTPMEQGALILSDSGLEDGATGHFIVETEIVPEVTQMKVEYGIDLSTPLKPVLLEKGYTPQDEEYLYLKGGDVSGAYQGSKFSASWDRNFYFLNITTGTMAATSRSANSTATNTTGEEFITERGFEALYVFDEGDGSRKIPAMYFPEDKREEVARLQFLDYLFFDFDYFVEQGARFSFLKFSVDEAVGRINDNLALYISDLNNGFAEQPREAGGLVLPLIYVDAYIQGRKIDILPGGFNQTVIEWSEKLNYNILTTPADQVFNVVPDTDAVMVNVYAFNHGDQEQGEPEARYYDVIRKDRQVDIDDLTVAAASSGEDLSRWDYEDPTLMGSAAPGRFLTRTLAVGICVLNWWVQLC